MHPNLQAALARQPAVPGPVDRAYLAAIEAYGENPGHHVLDQLPVPGDSNFALSLGQTAGHLFPDDGGLPALSELAAYALGREWFESPLAKGFFEIVLKRSLEDPSLQEEVIRFSRRMGVRDDSLATFAIIHFGHRFDFGWTRTEIEKPLSLHTRRAVGNLFSKVTEWMPPDSLVVQCPLEVFLMQLDAALLARLVLLDSRSWLGDLLPPRHFIATVACFRPDAFGRWIAEAEAGKRGGKGEWFKILSATDRWDDAFLTSCRHLPLATRLHQLLHLGSLRKGKGLEEAHEAALHPDQTQIGKALAFLAVNSPEDFFRRSGQLLARDELETDFDRWRGVSAAFDEAAKRWQEGGRGIYQALVDLTKKCREPDHSSALGTFSFRLCADAIPGLLHASSGPSANEVHDWLQEILLILTNGKMPREDQTAALERIWCEVIEHGPRRFLNELIELLGDDRKTLRSLAIEGLRHHTKPAVLEAIEPKLMKGSVNQRIGAVELLVDWPELESTRLLEGALCNEKQDKVRSLLHKALRLRNPGQDHSIAPASDLSDLEASFTGLASKLKLPAAPWFKLESHPPLFATKGTPLSPHAITFLISKQSKHKTLDAAPDLLPLLAHIDREKSPPFALALVEGFLNSEQAASDRWALALGGLLGDKRIIPPLLSRIPDWCENSRHKLAEYAAQAISLLPGNEPLMVLDALSNRYRSKFKNVGKACTAAFNAAAAARGITPDELGDLVVPDFGFDADGVRRFDWDGGGASAELGADFKLSWSDPDTDKSWKALPASAPAAVKEEVKTLGKLLREAVKGQTARLEMTLVRQRRWPVARWRELYEAHPLLRSFASSLVWGIYDASGTLLRTFRRYPNGLLAGAAGELEELPEADTMVGMVHPLELDAAALDAWRAHLARFKVKQPFPQIDRPVELMDPLHGNRREIALTKGGKVSAGTFRSRSEKRGWTRGSVVDAGGISSYYKLYPGAGVEVVLPTDNFYVGIDPMEAVELGAAYFAKAGSVERGSYTYDEPAPDDPRVLRFDQVPAVVWSETMSDLKAILG